MNIDVNSCIADLLYQQKSVIIPDFGGLVGIYESAQIDHVQGILHPPALTLRFNENLVINDGVLISHIRNKHQLSLDEAQFIVRNHVEELNRKLGRKEIVILPGIGRLYRDFENNLRFLQDSTNFNTDTFGLPDIQFFPILRNRETAFKEAPAPLTKTTPAPKRRLPWFAKQEFVPVAAGAMVLIIALAILFGSRPEAADDFTAKPVADRYFNQKPIDNQSAILDYALGPKEVVKETTPELEEPAPAEIVEDEMEEEEYPAEIDTEASTLAPQEKICLVITGAFAKKESIQKRLDEIIKLGFAPYQDKVGNLTRVGIQFTYETEDDILDHMDILKRDVERKSWILDK